MVEIHISLQVNIKGSFLGTTDNMKCYHMSHVKTKPIFGDPVVLQRPCYHGNREEN